MILHHLFFKHAVEENEGGFVLEFLFACWPYHSWYHGMKLYICSVNIDKKYKLFWSLTVDIAPTLLLKNALEAISRCVDLLNVWIRVIFTITTVKKHHILTCWTTFYM